MTALLTIDQLLRICPNLPRQKAELLLPSLLAAMAEREIDRPLRIAAFVATLAHESGEFRVIEEDLWYSAGGLLRTFGKYFTPVQAQAYARQPEKIANRAYANRGGNGLEESGDGWRYRGRGYIQVTLKENYRKASAVLGVDLVKNPALAAEPATACFLAAWFWQANGCNQKADADDLRGVTKIVNGGQNGLRERLRFYERAKVTLGVASSAQTQPTI